MFWLKEKGIEVTGINITKSQVNYCNSRGLDVIYTNWKLIYNNEKHKRKLYNKFDVVTFFDTVEHYVPAKYRKDTKKQNEIYSNMFIFAKECLSDKSKLGKIWISCLHFNYSTKPLKHRINGYFLDKFHSGYYPSFKNRQLSNNASNFVLVSEENKTEDYFMTSQLEPTHFGKLKFKLTKDRLITLLLNNIFDPNWIQKYIWFWSESWMVQFNSNDFTNSTNQLLWLQFKINS